MKRLLWVVVVVLLSLGAIPLSFPAVTHLTLTAIAETQQDPATITVYITKTGEKYHRDGCRYLSRSKIATTLKDAVERGYGPCRVCKPPTASR